MLQYLSGNEKRMKYQGLALIPDLASIIIVPDAVHQQWIAEFHRFIMDNYLELHPIKEPDLVRRRQMIWKAMNTGAPQGSKVILMSLMSLRHEFRAKYKVVDTKPDENGIFPLNPTAPLPGYSIYDYNYVSAFSDELHEARNYGEKHNATLALFQHASFTGGMTATPLNTKVEDIPMIGRVLGFNELTGKQGSDFIHGLAKEMNRSRKRAARARTETGIILAPDSISYATREGLSNVKDYKINSNTKLMAFALSRVKRIRGMYLQHFIRRTKDSKQPDGTSILHLPRLTIIRVNLRPNAHEAKLLKLDAELVRKITEQGGGMGSDPYVSYLLHFIFHTLIVFYRLSGPESAVL